MAGENREVRTITAKKIKNQNEDIDTIPESQKWGWQEESAK